MPVETNELAPRTYRTARVDPLAVARFAAEAARTGLINTAVDYGRPPIPDIGATTVLLHGTDTEVKIAVFGFGFGPDRYLTRRQRANRSRLQDLIARAHQLDAEAETTAYVPARVRVLELLDSSSTPAPVDWPGPEPATFLGGPPAVGRFALACGTLTGKAARTVYAAARRNLGQRWAVDGVNRTLVVNPLPLDLDC